MTYTCARTRDPIVKSGVRHKSLLIEFLQVSESEGKVSAGGEELENSSSLVMKEGMQNDD